MLKSFSLICVHCGHSAFSAPFRPVFSRAEPLLYTGVGPAPRSSFFEFQMNPQGYWMLILSSGPGPVPFRRFLDPLYCLRSLRQGFCRFYFTKRSCFPFFYETFFQLKLFFPPAPLSLFHDDLHVLCPVVPTVNPPLLSSFSFKTSLFLDVCLPTNLLSFLFSRLDPFFIVWYSTILPPPPLDLSEKFILASREAIFCGHESPASILIIVMTTHESAFVL